MKNIAVLAVILIGSIFYFINQDPFPSSIYFSGDTLQLGKATGKKGLIKTYQYTKSGNTNGINDYVQVFVIDKSEETEGYLKPTKEFLRESYKLKSLGSLNGEFGVFSTASEQRDYFAYFIQRESASANWLITFVIQSNFGENLLSPSTAKNNSEKNISSLESVFNELSANY